nr:MAG TPA: hypothetical protein [Caudoviricetes sp.]
MGRLPGWQLAGVRFLPYPLRGSVVLACTRGEIRLACGI